jgi:hypothetical protein
MHILPRDPVSYESYLTTAIQTRSWRIAYVESQRSHSNLRMAGVKEKKLSRGKMKRGTAGM